MRALACASARCSSASRSSGATSKASPMSATALSISSRWNSGATAGGGRRAMRIAVARNAMPGPGGKHQRQRIDANRQQRKPRPHRGQPGRTQHHGERHCAARRVQAAQQAHGDDRPAHRHARRQRRHRHQRRRHHADQRRNNIAAQHRPRLRQRTGRHGEHQHRRGTDGRDHHQAGCPGGHQARHRSGQRDAQHGGQAGTQAIAKIGAGKSWKIRQFQATVSHRWQG